MRALVIKPPGDLNAQTYPPHSEGIFVLVGTAFTLNYFLFPKFNVPTVSDYVKLAKPWIPTIQAAYDYQTDHGVMPRQLQDLVPTYLPSIPQDPNGLPVTFDEYGLSIHAPAPHTGIVYSFIRGQEGCIFR